MVAPAVLGRRCRHATSREQCTTGGLHPSGIREVYSRNVVERALLLADGQIQPKHLPPEIAQATGEAEVPGKEHAEASALAEQERKLVLDALQQNNWNQSAAARQLGITRDILRYRVKRYGLLRPGAE